MATWRYNWSGTAILHPASKTMILGAGFFMSINWKRKELEMKEWKDPAILLLAIGISNVGAWIYLIALNLTVLELADGSPFAVAILYMIGPVAVLATGFWSGSLVDRGNKRKLLIALDGFRAAIIFILPFADSLPVIYLAVFVLGIGGAVFEPASMAYISMLLKPEQRKRFNALRSLATSGAFLVGPAAAGLLLAIGPPEFAIWINAAALAFAGILATRLPDLEPHGASGGAGKMSFKAIKGDWQAVRYFSRRNSNVTGVYVVFLAFMVMATALDSLEVSFATLVLGLSNSQYGILVSTAGAGIIAGALLNAAVADRLAVTLLLRAGTVGTALGYLLYAFSGTFAAAASGFFLLAFALGFANTGFQTFCQEEIPTAIMGRFVSLFSLVEALGILAATAALAAAASLFSVQSTVIGGSLVMLGVAAAMSVFTARKREAALEN